jgi:hypothetical protein
LLEEQRLKRIEDKVDDVVEQVAETVRLLHRVGTHLDRLVAALRVSKRKWEDDDEDDGRGR